MTKVYANILLHIHSCTQFHKRFSHNADPRNTFHNTISKRACHEHVNNLILFESRRLRKWILSETGYGSVQPKVCPKTYINAMGVFSMGCVSIHRNGDRGTEKRRCVC